MLGHAFQQLTTDLRTDAEQLDDSCRRLLGISGVMFRTVKFLFYITALVFAGYLIEIASVQPFVAMLFTAVLITGPEGVEAYLIRRGVIDGPDDPE